MLAAIGLSLIRLGTGFRIEASFIDNASSGYETSR